MMRRVACLAILLLVSACGETAAPAPPVGSDLSEVLGGDDAGFARAVAPRDFVFPRDHGSHPEFRTEWWYFTGHLADAGTNEFGFQFTLFRSGVAADDAAEPAGWRPRDLWMGHFAVGDFSREQFYPFERFARGAVGLAGASETGFEAWLENWRVKAVDPARGDSPVLLDADADEVALRLRLVPTRPPVLQGDAGLSQKGAEPGNASYYYSMPRWEAEGTVRVPAGTFEVAGSAWLDREWSTSVLEPGQVGWDWFSLQLDDGSDLMLYVMRRDDGSVDRHSSGTLVDAAGTATRLRATDFEITPTATWTAPEGHVYPAAWRVRVPDAGLDLEVIPQMADQELRLTFRYWEGAVVAAGSRAGRDVGGLGFVELTGYDRPAND